MGLLEEIFIGLALGIPCIALLCAATWSGDDCDDPDRRPDDDLPE